MVGDVSGAGASGVVGSVVEGLEAAEAEDCVLRSCR